MAAAVKADVADDPSTVTLHDESGAVFGLLDRLGCSLVLSTDDSRLILIGMRDRKPNLRALVLPNLRGVAAQGHYLAVGSAHSVVVFKNIPGLAPVTPDAPDTYDAVYTPRAVHFTGMCDFHDMAFVGGAVTAVNTKYSCICAVDGRLSFTPLWNPPFISALLPQDRCHLNGMAVDGNTIRYVSLLARSDEPHGWRKHFQDEGGLLLEVPSGRVVASGLSLPHSPRLIGGRLYCLDSGHGRLVAIDPATQQIGELAALPGFPHGMQNLHNILFIAVSKLRYRRPERPLPFEQRGVEPICGIVAFDLVANRLLGLMEIRGGIHEIYDLQILPDIRQADIRGLEAIPEHHAIELPNSCFWATELASKALKTPHGEPKILAG